MSRRASQVFLNCCGKLLSSCVCSTQEHLESDDGQQQNIGTGIQLVAIPAGGGGSAPTPTQNTAGGSAPAPAPARPSAPPQMKYGKLQRQGGRMREWISDANKAHCPVSASTLTLQGFQGTYSIPCDSEAKNLDQDLRDQVIALGLPKGFEKDEDSVYRYFDIQVSGLTWTGYTGPGLIVMDVIERDNRRKVSPPWISDVARVLYEKDFSIADLRYVFLTEIVNDETVDMINRLYNESLGITLGTSTPQNWAFKSPEYDALLGTRLGKTVSALVLSSFDRGTRRIEQIVSWPSPSSGNPCLRFDITVIGS